MKTINYKSNDNYFDIVEQLDTNKVIVTSYFSTPIFGIENFKTIRWYSLEGFLIRYENSLGDIIDYDNPIENVALPRILKDL